MTCKAADIDFTEYPYPTATNHRRLLETSDWEAYISRCVEVFELGLRAITHYTQSPYLLHDPHHMRDVYLDRILPVRLRQASSGQRIVGPVQEVT